MPPAARSASLGERVDGEESDRQPVVARVDGARLARVGAAERGVRVAWSGRAEGEDGERIGAVGVVAGEADVARRVEDVGHGIGRAFARAKVDVEEVVGRGTVDRAADVEAVPHCAEGAGQGGERLNAGRGDDAQVGAGRRHRRSERAAHDVAAKAKADVAGNLTGRHRGGDEAVAERGVALTDRQVEGPVDREQLAVVAVVLLAITVGRTPSHAEGKVRQITAAAEFIGGDAIAVGTEQGHRRVGEGGALGVEVEEGRGGVGDVAREREGVPLDLARREGIGARRGRVGDVAQGHDVGRGRHGHVAGDDDRQVHGLTGARPARGEVERASIGGAERAALKDAVVVDVDAPFGARRSRPRGDAIDGEEPRGLSGRIRHLGGRAAGHEELNLHVDASVRDGDARGREGVGHEVRAVGEVADGRGRGPQGRAGGGDHRACREVGVVPDADPEVVADGRRAAVGQRDLQRADHVVGRRGPRADGPEVNVVEDVADAADVGSARRGSVGVVRGRGSAAVGRVVAHVDQLAVLHRQVTNAGALGEGNDLLRHGAGRGRRDHQGRNDGTETLDRHECNSFERTNHATSLGGYTATFTSTSWTRSAPGDHNGSHAHAEAQSRTGPRNHPILAPVRGSEGSNHRAADRLACMESTN